MIYIERASVFPDTVTSHAAQLIGVGSKALGERDFGASAAGEQEADQGETQE